MFTDGIYKIAYAQDEQPEDAEIALAVVRNGAVMASDRHGGVYMGAEIQKLSETECRLFLTATVPANGVMASGFEAGPDGADLAICAVLDASSHHQRAIVAVGGATMVIDVVYLGPLPN
ncbi:MAG: hypothetical protein K2X41_10135 [Hyphomicrobium sp.]|nr:hypothetical protein [Hyphomicrobium sp.]